jgi:hypothetical protein
MSTNRHQLNKTSQLHLQPMLLQRPLSMTSMASIPNKHPIYMINKIHPTSNITTLKLQLKSEISPIATKLANAFKQPMLMTTHANVLMCFGVPRCYKYP